MKAKVKRQKAKVRPAPGTPRGARPAARRLLLLTFFLFPFSFFLLCCAGTARAQYGRPPESRMPQGESPQILKTVGVEQRLGAQLPLDAVFRDEAGREVRLGEYFKAGRPVLLTLVYYGCPMLCGEILKGVTGSLMALRFTPGQEFEVVTVSFDARETPELAAQKKETYMRRYGREGAGAGWHFLTGDQASIDALTRAAGWNYTWDEQSKQFAHASAIMVATGEGRLSHYFYGIEYAPKELRLALVEASAGRIGTPVDQLLLYCYHYDPTRGGYAPVIINIMRVAGVLTVLGLAAFILLMRRWRPRGGGEWDAEINVGGTA